LKSLLSFPTSSSSSAASPFPFSSLENPIPAVGADINYLLLWLFSVGAAEADGRIPEHDWFVGHLVVVVSEVGIQNWEAMREVLVGFIWHDTFCEGPFRDVWEEVEGRREVLRGLEREVG
jgi:hypothetical protein